MNAMERATSFGLTPTVLTRAYNDLIAKKPLISLITDPDTCYLLVSGALASGDRGMLQALVDLHVDINNPALPSDTPLLHVLISGNVENGVEIFPKKSQLRAIRMLLDAGADVNIKGSVGSTPLHGAAYENNIDVARLLISRGADVNASDDRGVTPIMVAIRTGNIDFLNFLIGHGADLNTRNRLGPATFALVGGKLETLEILLDNGADPNPVLFAAGCHGDVSAIQCLLDHGADVNFIDSGETPLVEACTAGNYLNVELLIARGADVNLGRYSPLTHAVNKGRTDLISLLAGHGANPNAVDEQGLTPLLRAIHRNDIESVRELLRVGASPDVPSVGNAVAYARQEKHEEIVALLIARGATDTLAEDNKRIDETVRAVTDNDLPRLKELLDGPWYYEEGAKRAALIALVGAVIGGNYVITRSVLARLRSVPCGRIAGESAWEGETFLTLAVKSGHVKIVKVLLRAGFEPNVPNRNGFYPLHVAAGLGRLEMVVKLLDSGANINALGPQHQTPLMSAIVTGHNDVVMELLRRSADTRYTDDKNRTALMIAADRGQIDIGEALIVAKANLNTQDFEGWTALMIAADNGHNDFVELLITTDGILIDLRNKAKETALEVAIAAGAQHVINLLRQVA